MCSEHSHAMNNLPKTVVHCRFEFEMYIRLRKIIGNRPQNKMCEFRMPFPIFTLYFMGLAF